MAEANHVHRVDIHCIDCVQEKIDKYEKLLKFVKSIVETTTFSTANYWYLHKEAKELLDNLDKPYIAQTKENL